MSLNSLRAVHNARGPWRFVRKQVLRSYARVIEWTTRLPGRGLNLNRVSDTLWVGGEVRRTDYPKLAGFGIRAVLDLRAEKQDDARALLAVGIEYLNLPSPDRFAPALEQLRAGVEWMLPRVQRGEAIYVHCQHGVGRAPLMALCLMVAQGSEPEAAYRRLRDARWQATLNDRQLRALAEFASSQPR